MLSRNTTTLVVICTAYVVLFWLWASFGFPTEAQICKEAATQGAQPNCTNHNIIYFILWWIGENSATLTVIGTFTLAAIVLGQLVDARRSNERQLRAYVNVVFLGLVHQDRATNYHFEIRIALVNTGRTPGYNVQNRSQAAVLPFPLPADFSFPLPPEDAAASSGVVGPNQNFIIGAPLDRLLTDEEIHLVSVVGTSQLHIWGTITYRDAFGVERFTHFCQRVAWLQNGQHMSFNTRRHNDSN